MVLGTNKENKAGRQGRRFIAPLIAVVSGVLGLLVFVSLLAAAPAGELALSPETIEIVADNGQTVAVDAEQDEVADEPRDVVDDKEQGAALEAGEVTMISGESPGTEPAAVTEIAGGQKALVRYDQDTGAPAFIAGDIEVEGGTPVESAYAFLETNRDLYQLDDPKSELLVEEADLDELGMAHVRLSQSYMGIPVFGADMVVHLTAEGKISAANGKYFPGIDVDTEPGLDREEAEGIASAALGEDEILTVESTDLVLLASGGADVVLVWKIILTSDDPPLREVFFVDAQKGAVVSSYDDLQDIKNRKTYTANYGTSLPGTLLISEGGSSGDSVAQAAHNNIGATYDYFHNSFGRDSYNNAGADLKSTVHYSSNYNNAFWNGSQMTYGDGDGYVFSPLGNSLDVVAHELSHGVTQYSAGLIYSYQSGALNESYSDVFGVMVDRNDWLLGEDVYTPQTPGDALRSISNPAQFGQPAHMNNYVSTSSDNGGVHTNSGIPNKAAYNVAVAIGKPKMEQIWYRTLTLYLTSSSQFTDARDASVQAAIDLYGAGSSEVTAVVNGFNAVGIGGSQLSDTTARIEIDHTYRGDLVVTLGVGDPSSPLWSTVVSNRSGGSADNIYRTVDIADAIAHLPPDWQNRWFLKVYDAANYDNGTIKKFSITDHEDTFTATDLPMAIEDLQTVTSYLPTIDETSPTAVSFSPQPSKTGVYAQSSIVVGFSETLLPSTINGTSFFLTESGGGVVPASLKYNNANQTVTLTPHSRLEYLTTYEVEVNTNITDAAGNPLQQVYRWSFTTAPEPKLYYFTWYDMNSASMSDWVVMGNPDSHAYDASFSVHLNNIQAASNPIIVKPGDTEAATYPGQVGGPVAVAALDGESQIVSKRTLYGGSLEEVVGVEAEALDSHYYFTWYDGASPGARDWILVSNPDDTPLAVDIYIGGSKVNGASYWVAPGATITPEFMGMMGGPVDVLAFEPGNPGSPRDAIVSQRVTWKGDFTEVMGIPASGLSASYMYSWYDMKSAGARSWILVANPHYDKNLAVEIRIAGERMTDPATGLKYFTVPAGSSLTPTFPGMMNGPVEVRGYDKQTYNPDNPGTPDLSFYSTQRSLYGENFEEVLGYGLDKLSSSYFFTWYDFVSSGSRNWVLVANPGNQPVVAEIWIAGSLMSRLAINPGTTQTPAYPGVMNGPVEVRGYLASTYNANSPGAPNASVFTSQRVLWRGNFNEVTGTVID